MEAATQVNVETSNQGALLTALLQSFLGLLENTLLSRYSASLVTSWNIRAINPITALLTSIHLPLVKFPFIKYTPTFLVVVGASAGGFSALDQVVAQLQPQTDAAYCIVLHLSDASLKPFLVNRLQKLTSLTCLPGEEGVELERGHIYVAQPGNHLLVKHGRLMIGYGPEENGFRPSIDILFRSAAVDYSSNTIGIILTGLRQDGTSGMEAIKLSGGTLIVQDPAEAEFGDMPRSVLTHVDVDHRVKLSAIGPLIQQIVQTKIVERKPVPAEIAIEARRSEKMAVGIKGMDEIGQRSPYGCPDCGGTLWETKAEGDGNRFRCHVGHAFMETDLLSRQVKAAETAIWVALRMLEERKHLLRARAEEYRERRLARFADNYYKKAEELKENIDQLKAVLQVIELEQQQDYVEQEA